MAPELRWFSNNGVLAVIGPGGTRVLGASGWLPGNTASTLRNGEPLDEAFALEAFAEQLKAFPLPADLIAPPGATAE